MDNLLNVKELEKIITERRWENELKIDKINIQDEALAQPSHYAFWAEKTVAAEFYLQTISLEQKSYEAELYSIFSLELKKEKERVTDKAIQSKIERHADWVEKEKEVIKWKNNVNLLKEVVNAFKQRSQSIWIFGLMSKEEFFGQKQSHIA